MPAQVPIRILLVDDQPLFRGAIASLINGQDDMTVVGEADNGLDAVEKARLLVPDLVVMDVEMPVMNGVEATRLIREQLSTVKVVMLAVAEGLSNKEIGKKLSITEGTVKNHVHNALEKLHMENRIQATAYIVRQGLGRRPVAD